MAVCRWPVTGGRWQLSCGSRQVAGGRSPNCLGAYPVPSKSEGGVGRIVRVGGAAVLSTFYKLNASFQNLKTANKMTEYIS